MGFEGYGWHEIRDLREIVQEGRDACVVVDPRPDLNRVLAQITADYGDDPSIHILGIGRLDVADRSTYEALMDQFEGRWYWSSPEMPVIDF